MPNPQYAWNSSNTTSSVVSLAMGLASGLEIGSSYIVAANVRIPDNRATGLLHVAEPGAADMRTVPTGE